MQLPAVTGHFLIAIFDEWVRHDVGRVFMQFFDGVLAAYVRGFSCVYMLQPTCGRASRSSTTATCTGAI